MSSVMISEIEEHVSLAAGESLSMLGRTRTRRDPHRGRCTCQWCERVAF